MEKLIVKALRGRWRFDSTRGKLTVEDLFTLPVDILDNIYKALKKLQKVNEEESLLQTKTAEESILNDQIEIVKGIVKLKLEEAATKKIAAEKAAQRRKIISLIADKKEAELAGKTVEELEKELLALED